MGTGSHMVNIAIDLFVHYATTTKVGIEVHTLESVDSLKTSTE